MAERLQQLGLKFAALFERQYFSNISRYTASVKQATKATTDGAARMSRATNEMTQTVSSSVSEQGRLAQELRNQGAAIGDIAKFMGVSTSAVREWTGATGEAQVATGGLTKGVEETGQAVRRSSSYLTRYLTRLALWVTVGATVRGVIRALTRTLKESSTAIYGQTEEWERATDASKRASLSFVATAGELTGIRGVIGFVADELETLSQMFLLTGAVVAGAIEEINVIIEGIRERDWSKLLPGAESARVQAAANEFLARTFGLVEDAMEETEDETKDYERALDSLISAAQRFDKEMARHAERLAEVNQAYQVSMLAAGADYYREAEQIALNEQDKIAEINLDALDRRESALKKFQDRINQLEQRGANQRQANAERHALQMEQRQQRHDLTMAQSQRRYQSSRSRLVAEGDTIAIEELDERHAIEQAEREENFRLQQQQAEAMFQLQQRLQEEANRQQIALMRQALMEQLRLIEEQRQERVEEAQETADEERAEAADAAADKLTDAKAAQIEELAQEEKAHQERVAALGEFLRKFADDNELGLDEVLRIWQSRYGTGGPIDNAIRTAFQQYTGYVNAFIRSIQQALAGVQGLGGGLPGRPPRGGGPPRYQYGGDIIAGRPTQFTAGEGNAPEIVSVRPISPIGGAGQGNAMTHRWGGGAIPVHGTGSLEGMDLSDLGDAIGAGLMSEMRRQGAARVGSMH